LLGETASPDLSGKTLLPMRTPSLVEETKQKPTAADRSL